MRDMPVPAVDVMSRTSLAYGQACKAVATSSARFSPGATVESLLSSRRSCGRNWCASARRSNRTDSRSTTHAPHRRWLATGLKNPFGCSNHATAFFATTRRTAREKWPRDAATANVHTSVPRRCCSIRPSSSSCCPRCSCLHHPAPSTERTLSSVDASCQALVVRIGIGSSSAVEEP